MNNQGWTCPTCCGGVAPTVIRCPCKALPVQVAPLPAPVPPPGPYTNPEPLPIPWAPSPSPGLPGILRPRWPRQLGPYEVERPSPHDWWRQNVWCGVTTATVQ